MHALLKKFIPVQRPSSFKQTSAVDLLLLEKRRGITSAGSEKPCA
jgi:hypothetical protein